MLNVYRYITEVNDSLKMRKAATIQTQTIGTVVRAALNYAAIELWIITDVHMSVRLEARIH